MKIMVLGATSPTGQEILSALKQTPNELSVYVRNPAKIVDESSYPVFTGDMLDKQKLVKLPASNIFFGLPAWAFTAKLKAFTASCLIH